MSNSTAYHQWYMLDDCWHMTWHRDDVNLMK